MIAGGQAAGGLAGSRQSRRLPGGAELLEGVAPQRRLVIAYEVMCITSSFSWLTTEKAT